MSKKQLLFISLALVLILLVAALFFIFNKKDLSKITLYGNIEIRQVDLAFRVDGRVKKLFFEEGDLVQKGDLVALLDDVVYVAKYRKSLFDVNQAQAQSDNAQTLYERNIELCKDGSTSKQECDKIFRNKKETYSKLKSQIEQGKIYKDDFENTRIYAPNEGIITVRVAEEGAVVKNSDPIYTLSLTKPVWVRAYVSEVDLGNIKYSMPARVYTDSIDPKTNEKRFYMGKVGYISPVAEFTPKTVQTTQLRTDLVYRVRIYIDEVDEFLRQGMPVTVELDLNGGENDNCGR